VRRKEEIGEYTSAGGHETGSRGGREETAKREKAERKREKVVEEK